MTFFFDTITLNVQMETFIDRLETLLKSHHMTQAALADSVGLRRTTISDWKKNGNYPTADIACKMAKILDTTVEYLVTGTTSNVKADKQVINDVQANINNMKSSLDKMQDTINKLI